MDSDEQIKKFEQRFQLSMAMTISLGIVLIGVVLLWISVDLTDAKYKELAKSFALALIPAGIISVLLDVSLKRSFVSELERSSKQALSGTIYSVDRFHKLGVNDVAGKLPDDLIAKGIKNSIKSVRILNTWMPNHVSIEKELIAASNSNVDIKILLLDPTSPHAEARANDLGFYGVPEYAKNKIESSLIEITKIFNLAGRPKNFELRLFTATPTIVLHAFDSNSFVGMFWYGRSSLSGPQINIGNPASDLGESIESHFMSVWETSEPYEFRHNTTEG